LSAAQARYEQLFGAVPSGAIGRTPLPALQADSVAAARDAASGTAAVRVADAIAEATRQDARAAGADRLPVLGVSLSAGRYGVFENSNDYAVSARATLRMRLSGGIDSFHRQAQARADGARARADRIRDEAERDAAIAWTDVGALTDELAAMEASYRAARQSRDVLAERFRISRGTLFELLESEQSSSSAAEGYIQTLVELDAARYVLLARTGRLLPVFGISAASAEKAR
jgi:outer membrane protein, adhesin transport system